MIKLGRFFDRSGWLGVACLHLLFALVFIPGETFQKYGVFSGLLKSGQLIGENAASPSPLYLLLHCALSSTSVRIFQVLVGCGVIRSVYLLGLRFGGRGCAWMGSVLLAGSRPFLIYESLNEPDFLLMASFFFGIELLFFEKSKRAFILSGILLGIAASLRPIVLPVAIVVLLLSNLRDFKKSHRWIAFLGLFFFALLPAQIVSVFSGSSSTGVFGTMSGGTVLYEGSRPESMGDGAAPPFVLKLFEKQIAPAQNLPDYAHVLYRRFARIVEAKPLSLNEAQAYWISLWKKYFEFHPKAFIQLQIKKLIFTLVGSTAVDVRQARKLDFRWDGKIFPWSGFFLFEGGLAAVICFSLISLRSFCFAGVWASLAVLLSLFYPSVRYTTVLLPFEALFLAYFLVFLTRKRDWTLGNLTAGAIGLLLACFFANMSFVRESRRFEERLITAARKWPDLSAQADFPYGEWEADFRFLPFESPHLSDEAAEESVKRWGLHSTADRVFAAQLYERAGRCDRAEEIIGGIQNESFSPFYYDLLFDPDLILARCSIARADWENAEQGVDRSLRTFPGNAEALALGYALELKRSRGPESLEFKKELMALHDPISSEYALARSLRTVGIYPEASQHIRQAQEYLPDFFLFEYEDSLILAGEGRWAESAKAFNRAIDLYPGFNYRVLGLDRGFEKLFSEMGGDPEVATARIRELARLGEVERALAIATQWVKKSDPSDRKKFELMETALKNIR